MAEIIARKITVQQFREMDFPENDFHIYELINGELMRRTAPKPLHQSVSWKLGHAIENYIQKTAIGIGFSAPIDVFFDDHNQTQPDLIFISKARDFIIDKEWGIMGAPDLVVEIISPSSIKIDRFDKKDMYKQFAVKEYWLIDPKNQTLELYLFEGDDYKLHQFLQEESLINSTILMGLELDVKTIFA
jgi:Uma2 family endonuclease